MSFKTAGTTLYAGFAGWIVTNATLISTVLGICTFVMILTFHVLNYLKTKRKVDLECRKLKAEIDKLNRENDDTH